MDGLVRVTIIVSLFSSNESGSIGIENQLEVFPALISRVPLVAM